MSTFVSRDLQQSLDAARQRKKVKASRLRLVTAQQNWPILRMWDTGIAVALEEAPQGLRGFVDIYEGDEHLFQCLIVANEAAGPEVHFAFKRMTAIRSGAPLDFAKAEDAPAALIEHLD